MYPVCIDNIGPFAKTILCRFFIFYVQSFFFHCIHKCIASLWTRISCNETNVAKPDIRVYPDIIENGDPLKIKTVLTLISIAEVCLHQNI